MYFENELLLDEVKIEREFVVLNNFVDEIK